MPQPIRQQRLHWRRAVHIVPGRFPRRDPFERVADPADLDAVRRVEALTNARLRQERGEIALVPAEDCISGPGTAPVMAAFTHPNPVGSRFSNGAYGVYYAAADEATAIAETVFHRARFLGYSAEPPMRIEMRMYVGPFEADVVDLRGLRDTLPQLYNADDYRAAQAFGDARRARQVRGIVYDSVRYRGGECVAVFRPPAVLPVVEAKHFQYVWNGERITDVLAVAVVESWK